MAKRKDKNEQLMLEGVKAPELLLDKKETIVEEPLIDENQISIDDIIGDSILETDTVNKLMKEAVASEQQTKKKKSTITSLIFLAINIVFMVFIVKSLLDSASGNSIIDIFKLQGSRMWWLLGGFGLLILFFICETLTFSFYMRKTTGKRKLFLSYRLAVVGKYYDFLTPTQIGGQPSQILRLAKSGMAAGLATSIPIIKLIVYNFVYTIISIILFFFAVPLIPVSGSLQGFIMALIKIIGAIGLIVTVVSCFLYTIIGNGKIIGRSFVQWIVRLGYKLKIVKNYRKTFDRILTQVREYQSSIKYLRQNKGTLIVSVLLALIECVAFALIPFCVTMAFSNFAFTSSAEVFYVMLITMSQYYLCLMVSTCLPLPGGTGSMEICYIFLFGIGAFSVGENIVWALIFFRIITYYSVILQGFVHILIENIVKIAKNKKNKLVVNKA